MSTTHATRTEHTVQSAADEAAAEARHARFGHLPERIPATAMVEEQPATPKGLDGYDEEHSWLYYSCVALDLGF